MAKLSTDEILDAIDQLSVLELNDLVKKCEDKYGVSAAAGVVVAGPAAGAAAAEEEKTEFDVELTEVGPNKIKVIKEALPKADAEALKAKLEEQGAKATLK